MNRSTSNALPTFAALALVLAACAQADSSSVPVITHDGGLDAFIDVRPGTDTGLPPDDTGSPSEDTGVGGRDTAGGTDTATCTVPSGKACGTLPQCGCAGQNCDVTKVDGTTGCVAAGPKSLHDDCSALGDCGAGLTCVAGNCLPFCNTASDCTSGSCVNLTDGATPPGDIPGYKVCFEDCDPISPSAACGSGSCQFADASSTVCTGAGGGTGAGGCTATTPYDCAPGYVCLTTNACAPWCRVGFPGDCPSGTCGSLTSAPTKAGVEYGVCN